MAKEESKLVEEVVENTETSTTENKDEFNPLAFTYLSFPSLIRLILHGLLHSMCLQSLAFLALVVALDQDRRHLLLRRMTSNHDLHFSPMILVSL